MNLLHIKFSKFFVSDKLILLIADDLLIVVHALPMWMLTKLYVDAI